MDGVVGGFNWMVVAGFVLGYVNGFSSVDGGGVDGVDGVYWVKVKVRWWFLWWRWSYETNSSSSYHRHHHHHPQAFYSH
ncbi:unnamed protein product [Prunus brigantina]